MEREELLKRHCALLKTITTLPTKIVSLQGTDNVSEFILHELCNKKCFNLPRAAYFVDNRDFNCLKGVAGFNHEDFKDQCVIDWQNPNAFCASMQASPFNQQVRSVTKPSYKKMTGVEHEMVKDLATHLGFSDHGFCAWPLKYENNGLFLYEQGDKQDDFLKDHLKDALSLLSFCPIF